MIVRAATTKVAADPSLDLLQRGVMPDAQQTLDGHDLPGGAIPALHAIVFDERRLHRMQMLGCAQPFDGCDLAANCIEREGHAGVHRSAIQ